MMVMTLRRLSQYSSCVSLLARHDHNGTKNVDTSPYTRTVTMLAQTKINQKINPRAHAGKFVFQYSNTNCRATRSEAVETASLNQ